ncbi:MAG: pyruvate carboxylase [Pseudomonadota bacterium]
MPRAGTKAPPVRRFRKLLVANRGEIAIRVFRACTELGIRTVAIYSEQDRLHLHRYKADEAYLVGVGKEPVRAYLDYDEIIELARDREVDAIHPGYGFLSENAGFARACEAAGITFIGPKPDVIEAMGDKVYARDVAIRAGVPVIPGTDGAIETLDEAMAFAAGCGYPLIVKAAMGGGGRGMSIVRDEAALRDALARSQAEAAAAFGSAKVFIERYLEGPKHIEVQILGDRHGNRVHLFERDCSVQRRHQKVVEIAPALTLTEAQRQMLCADALKICAAVDYSNAGTVEFLLDREGRHYFIEVNPRIQVEHTITELITGRDLVQAQIRVAEGHRLDSDAIRIPNQGAIERHGCAIQVRITTEDPANHFAPDTGQITAFRAGEGFGIRLDAGSGFEGAVVSPHYDSLLIKVSAFALDFDQAAAKALRALREFRIRGVKTNIPFLENVLQHETFLSGACDTTFIENHPELFRFRPRQDRANKLLTYLGEVVVNGVPEVDRALIPKVLHPAPLPAVTHASAPTSRAYEMFERQGAAGLARWVLQQRGVLLTDTTFRDAHQSLLATRVRTHDLERVAHATAHLTAGFFSHEMWGGATFDVAYRFLHEDPWQRLRVLRQRMPGTLLQMLLRAGNAVGYANYPDNVVARFIELAAGNGIDVFRIFDCLNQVENLRPSIDKVVACGKVAEGTVCYSGDITDGKRAKFTLPYYVDRARQIEAAGAHILAIKDMAGLLKPDAARLLVSELKNALTIPVHLHTHDTAGNAVATLLAAADAGVDIVDGALSSMSGTTSQPSLNALVYALASGERATGIDPHGLQALADYWEVAREAYAPFECGLKAGSADVYEHEMPGGQYSNFRAQAVSMGLGERWAEVKRAYRTVNDMLGDIVKVTPSSKAVGDMALFMVQNELTPQDVIDRAGELAFPDAFVDLLAGRMGQPDGGFPKALQKAVLKGDKPLGKRPGELLEPYDFDAARKATGARKLSEEDLVAQAMFPAVFRDYARFIDVCGDVSVIGTPIFFYGLKPGEEGVVTIEEGKTLIVKLLAIGELEPDGSRQVFFELNGRRRDVVIQDRSAAGKTQQRERADPDNANHIAAPMAGKVAAVHAKTGETVAAGARLLTTEAMKMVNLVAAPHAGTVKRLLVQPGDTVRAGDLLCELA